MFAVIQVGSNQYKIAEGDTIDIDRIDSEAGKAVNLDKVLLFANGAEVRVGQPYLKDVKITAKVVDQVQGEKTFAFKFRRRKGYHRKVGHRQDYTAVNITKISG